MSKAIVITLIGDDRPGIVEDVSRIIVNNGGEWVESHMANLSGKFAGILRANLPDERCDEFAEDLKSGIDDLRITIEQAGASEAPATKLYRLELVGQDRPGIVHRISSALAKYGATVDEMESEVIEASMSGEHLFKANIALRMAKGKSIDELGEVLEEIANELIVDIELG
jgi:glycine cleavage system regulatory protein